MSREDSQASQDTTAEIGNIDDDYGEILYFDYGCVVFWNFTQEQEIELLNDMEEYEKQKLSNLPLFYFIFWKVLRIYRWINFISIWIRLPSLKFLMMLFL